MVMRLHLTRIVPGVYDDGQGGCHIDLRELLEASGYSDTSENLAMLQREAEAFARGLGLPLTIFTHDVATVDPT